MNTITLSNLLFCNVTPTFENVGKLATRIPVINNEFTDPIYGTAEHISTDVKAVWLLNDEQYESLYNDESFKSFINCVNTERIQWLVDTLSEYSENEFNVPTTEEEWCKVIHENNTTLRRAYENMVCDNECVGWAEYDGKLVPLYFTSRSGHGCYCMIFKYN